MRGCVALFVMIAVTSVGAINLSVTSQDIDRALAIGRDRDRERGRFHAPYVTAVTHATLQSVEVITEFRRFVLATEEHLRRGDHQFGYSVRTAQYALAPWKGRVSVVLRLRFHPQNTYIDIPDVDVWLTDPRGELRPIGILKEPALSLGTGLPGEALPILGAVIDAVFDAGLVGQTRRDVIVRFDKKELPRTSVDFAVLE